MSTVPAVLRDGHTAALNSDFTVQDPSVKMSSIAGPVFRDTDIYNRYSTNTKTFSLTQDTFHAISQKKRPDFAAGEKLRVLHLSVEGMDGANVGGVAAVIRSLVHAENTPLQATDNHPLRAMDARGCIPFYDFLDREPFISRLKKIGEITHYFDGKMCTSCIYRSKTADGIRNYLIKPDARYANIFDVGQASDIYKEAGRADRTLYLSSAAAAFIAQKRTPFHIVQIHSPDSELTATLLKQVYRPAMIEKGQDIPAVVQTVHALTLPNDSNYSSEQIRKIGLIRDQLWLPIPGFNNIRFSLLAEGLLNADRIHTVSSALIEDATSPYAIINLPVFGKRHLYHEALEQGRIQAISNGINREMFDPRSERFYGHLRVGDDQIDLRKNEDEPLMSWKKRQKNYLVDKGLFTNPDLPFVVIVGRASPEKGVDMWQDVKNTLAGKANLLIMCTMTEDSRAREVVDSLVKQRNKDAGFWILTTLEEQLEIGLPRLSAADFVLVTSHEETDGVVPKETAIAGGSIILSSNVGGLKDTVVQLEKKPDGAYSGNGHLYSNNMFTRASNLSSLLNDTIAWWNGISTQEKENVHSHVMKNALSRFDWHRGGKLASFYELYEKAIADQIKQLESACKAT